MSKKIPAFLENKASLCRAFSLSGLPACLKGVGKKHKGDRQTLWAGSVLFFSYSQLSPHNLKVTSFSGFRHPANSWQL